jgi:hypothetical protein
MSGIYDETNLRRVGIRIACIFKDGLNIRIHDEEEV